MTVSKCLEWVRDRCLCNQRRTRSTPTEFGSKINNVLQERPVVHIPEDVIIDILSRLSAEDVMECRRVCKKWHEIISTPSFAELHLKTGATSDPPSIFLYKKDDQNPFECCIWDPNQTSNNSFWRRTKSINTTKIRTPFGDYRAVSCSVDGLLVFYLSVLSTFKRQVCILNPVVNEFLCLEIPLFGVCPCGIYRDPLTRDYKLLLVIGSRDSGWSHYYVFSLKTNVTKKLKYSSSWQAIYRYTRMILYKGSLHWLVGGLHFHNRQVSYYKIMVFNTATEDLCALPLPGVAPPSPQHDLDLLETREKLWFFKAIGCTIEVWVLEDDANWAWDWRYNVSLDLFWTFPRGINVAGINNGLELLIWVYGKGVFWYDLQRNTVRKASIFHDDSRVCSLGYTKTFVRPTTLVD